MYIIQKEERLQKEELFTYNFLVKYENYSFIVISGNYTNYTSVIISMKRKSTYLHRLHTHSYFS